MHIKWIGSVLIVAGCGGVGFSLSACWKKERCLLQSLLDALSFLECRLRCQLTPLPDLCREAGKLCGGALGEVFLNFSRELDWQQGPDPEGCMAQALGRSCPLPVSVRLLMQRLGATFGRFDLTGQLQEFDQLRQLCNRELDRLSRTLEPRMKTCSTLSLCAGAAAAILLL